MPASRRIVIALLGLALWLALGGVYAAIGLTDKVSDVRGTKHNLSAVPDGSATPSGGTVPVRTVKATSETQVCVFCHTPHGATTSIAAPLWNRSLSQATYTTYSSNSIEADASELAAGPGGSSKLCLSCHDGTMAIDKVNVLGGASNPTVAMTGLVGASGAGRMPNATADTGFTRNLGTDLGNDHPISFTYNAALAAADGELRTPDGSTVGTRTAGAAKPKMPLEDGQLQCATCHDPHLRDNTSGNGNAKFLRMNRFQAGQPLGGAFNTSTDIICLACHDKGGVAWAYSAHANSSVATQSYTGTAAQQREFPSSLDAPANGNPAVWQVACLNCHDTHTVQGARKLLREGTDSLASPKSGGNAAQEETCFQCHTTVAGSAVFYTALAATSVPDIKTDFNLTLHMPLRNSEQAAGTEVHDIGGVFNDGLNANCSNVGASGNCGKDLLESRDKLGASNLNSRHAECSDCHNPHRVIKYKSGLPGPLAALNFSNTGLSASGTHVHTDDATNLHSNVISGVLRGSWGVEPAYTDSSFHTLPNAAAFAVKRGDPGSNVAPLDGSRPGAETYVTREYQICMKCHSNYAYPDDNLYPNSANRPQLGAPGTLPNANGHSNFTSYTNQAKEFQAPLSHAVPVGSVSKGNEAGTGTAASNANNHRSWHPVMAPTGRVGRAGAWIRPWNDTGTGGKAGRLGVQTMFCSDCHGSDTGPTSGSPRLGTAIPQGGENGAPWGPHGSSNNFLLKGTWSTTSGEGDNNSLCFKCHSQDAYGGGGGTGWQTNKGDGHNVHSNKIGNVPMHCNWCHVAVPHGWKNRNLLVNLNDVGPEAGLAPGTAVSYPKDVGYTNGPYYRKAFLKIESFPPAGTPWGTQNCNGGLTNDPSGMKATCDAPL